MYTTRMVSIFDLPVSVSNGAALFLTLFGEPAEISSPWCFTPLCATLDELCAGMAGEDSHGEIGILGPFPFSGGKYSAGTVGWVSKGGLGLRTRASCSATYLAPSSICLHVLSPKGWTRQFHLNSLNGIGSIRGCIVLRISR